jgi:hypothetical protein
LKTLKVAIERQVAHALVLAREDLAGNAAVLRENYPATFDFQAAYSDGGASSPVLPDKTPKRSERTL